MPDSIVYVNELPPQDAFEPLWTLPQRLGRAADGFNSPVEVMMPMIGTVAIMAGGILLMYFFDKYIVRMQKMIAPYLGSWFTPDRDDEGNRLQPRMRPAAPAVSKYYHTYYGSELEIGYDEIHAILIKRFPYYKNLNQELKNKFLKRTNKFMRSKTFLIYSNDVFKEMPVMISACAVQLSFGLDRYLLYHYQYIQVHKEEYFAGDNSFRILAGHVQYNTITLAWNHFYAGYETPDNGVNIGLHEMAHALYFQKKHAMTIFDSASFSEQYIVVEGICEKYQHYEYCRFELYLENAFKSAQEFFAESIELFFERPAEVKRHYPDIYEELCTLLRQDPLQKESPLLINI